MIRVEQKILKHEESTWKPMSRVFANAPTVVLQEEELHKIRLEAKTKNMLNARYSEMCLLCVSF